MADPKPLLETSVLLERQISGLLHSVACGCEEVRATLAAHQAAAQVLEKAAFGERLSGCTQLEHSEGARIPGELPDTANVTGEKRRSKVAFSPAFTSVVPRERDSVSAHRLTVELAKRSANDERTGSSPKSNEKHRHTVFFDADTLKKKLKEDLSKDTYDVCSLYYTEGFCQRVARSRAFELATFAALASNALWTGIEMEINDAPAIQQAHPAIIVIENLFILFFSLELALRFGAFRRKKQALRDFWFVFDASLVLLMWSETWVLSLCLALFAPGTGSERFRLLRLLRFTRLARMARLLRSIPELLIIVRAIAIALKSVFFLMVLLLGLVYVFALLFTQLMDGKNQPPGSLAHDSFGTLPQAMNTLLLAGALPDQSTLVEDAGASHFLLYPLMLLYMLLASLTVMNMLVGILCEVVSVVSAVEKEEILLKSVKSLLKQLLLETQADEDGDGSISRREFDQMLTNPTCVRTLSDVGVDVFALVDLADFIFDQQNELSFAAFMDAVLQLRGSNTATVKDIVDLQKLIMNHFKYLERHLAAPSEASLASDKLAPPMLA